MPSMTVELRELEQRVHEVRRRVGELENKRVQARRAADRAKGPLMDYYERLGSGEREPHGDHERKLIAAVCEAEASVST